MSDPKELDIETLADRVDTLEARLTFQDDAIETLNKTVTEQWAKIEALTRRLVALSERLQEAESQMPGPANEPPPHY
jgi:SlyX protein